MQFKEILVNEEPAEKSLLLLSLFFDLYFLFLSTFQRNQPIKTHFLGVVI